MSNYAIVEATHDHINDLILNMRQEDADECWASSHSSPGEAIGQAMTHSDKSYAGLTPDGQVMCIFGLAPLTLLSDIGVPWMLATPQLDLHARKFARGSVKVMRWFTSAYPRLVNYVDARNASAINWIKWLGFTVEKARPYGPDDVLFHRFHWEQEDV